MLQDARRLTELQRWMNPRSFKGAITGLSAEQRHYLTERATFLLYCKVARPGDVVFDLGANHGDHTRPLSAIVGAHGRVHAFEPNPALVPALKRIGANVTVHEMAVSDHAGTARLHIPDGLDSWASLDDRRGILPEKKFTVHDVPVRALDAVPELARAHPCFVKMDVEGHELSALRGMESILKESRPIVVLESPNSEICHFFEKVEYRIFDFFGDSEYPLYPGLFNVVAVPYGFAGYETLFLDSQDFMFMFLDYLALSDIKQ
ncbi:MAG TPA: FkbM family methyltransferase [Luteimonas sp.]|nr:FkbM family methyltransferase [Luteimonas sp.]